MVETPITRGGQLYCSSVANLLQYLFAKNYIKILCGLTSYSKNKGVQFFCPTVYMYTVGQNHRIKYTWQLNKNTKILFLKVSTAVSTQDCYVGQRSCFDGLILRQDSAPANTARVTSVGLVKVKLEQLHRQGWAALEFMRSQFSRLSSRGSMLESYHKLQSQTKAISDLKDALQLIWSALPQKLIDIAVKDISKRLQPCLSANDGHYEHKTSWSHESYI